MQADRSLRSVFVGNIPYDATEEKLRDIFSAVGPVLSFRIVYDRETGKPKGYGFCEYKDQETATSAIRNLNGHDLGGRQLRVDSATNERARDEPEQQQQQQQVVNDNAQLQQMQHQQPPIAEPLVDAQTVINNVLCSLPPEQLFEICKQLKSSLLVNPNETRQILVQNPQLSFAILQSLVMIKAIDAQTAMNTLHKQLMQPAALQPAPLQPAMPPAMMAMMQPPVLNPYPYVGPPQPANLLPNTAPQAPPSQQQQQNSVPPLLSAVDPRLAQANEILLNPSVQRPGNPAEIRPMGPPTMPRMLPTEPRVGPLDPRINVGAAAPADPRLVASDPRLARQQAQQQPQQPGQQAPSTQWPFAAI